MGNALNSNHSRNTSTFSGDPQSTNHKRKFWHNPKLIKRKSTFEKQISSTTTIRLKSHDGPSRLSHKDSTRFPTSSGNDIKERKRKYKPKRKSSVKKRTKVKDSPYPEASIANEALNTKRNISDDSVYTQDEINILDYMNFESEEVNTPIDHLKVPNKLNIPSSKTPQKETAVTVSPFTAEYAGYQYSGFVTQRQSDDSKIEENELDTESEDTVERILQTEPIITQKISISNYFIAPKSPYHTKSLDLDMEVISQSIESTILKEEEIIKLQSEYKNTPQMSEHAATSTSTAKSSQPDEKACAQSDDIKITPIYPCIADDYDEGEMELDLGIDDCYVHKPSSSMDVLNPDQVVQIHLAKFRMRQRQLHRRKSAEWKRIDRHNRKVDALKQETRNSISSTLMNMSDMTGVQLNEEDEEDDKLYDGKFLRLPSMSLLDVVRI